MRVHDESHPAGPYTNRESFLYPFIAMIKCAYQKAIWLSGESLIYSLARFENVWIRPKNWTGLHWQDKKEAKTVMQITNGVMAQTRKLLRLVI